MRRPLKTVIFVAVMIALVLLAISMFGARASAHDYVHLMHGDKP